MTRDLTPHPSGGRDASTIRLDRLARIELREEGSAGDAGDTIVAALSGEVDISNVGELSRALTALPNMVGALIVDLSAVSYLDSAGVSLLHELVDRLDHRSQRLLVVCPEGAPCRRVLDLTGMDLRAPMLEDVPAALARLASA